MPQPFSAEPAPKYRAESLRRAPDQEARIFEEPNPWATRSALTGWFR